MERQQKVWKWEESTGVWERHEKCKTRQVCEERGRECVCVYHLNRCKTSYWMLIHLQGGAEHSGDCTQRSYPLVLEAESDQLCVPAEFGLNCWTSCPFVALLSQSEINFGHLRLVQLHQNLPQSKSIYLFLHGCHNLYFRRNHVADSISGFSGLFRRTMSPMYLDYFIKTTSPIHLFLMTILAMETIQENFYYS